MKNSGLHPEKKAIRSSRMDAWSVQREGPTSALLPRLCARPLQRDQRNPGRRFAVVESKVFSQTVPLLFKF